MHILVVEDDAIVARVLERIFRAHSITIVATVAYALEALDGRRFDAVVTDWDLYGQTSRPVIERCQRDGIPFRVFSGSYPEKDLWEKGVWICKTAPMGLRGFLEQIEGRRQR